MNFVTLIMTLPIQENPLPYVFLVLNYASLMKLMPFSGSHEEQEAQYRRMQAQQASNGRVTNGDSGV